MMLKAKEFLQNNWDKFEDVYFITGRNESSRDVTLQWLLDHYDIEFDGDDWEHLYMRPDGDIRPGAEVKEDLLKLKISKTDYHYITLANKYKEL